MKNILSVISFFSKNKIDVVSTQEPKIEDSLLDTNVKIKPIYNQDKILDTKEQCFFPTNHDTSSDIRAIIKAPSWMELNPNRELPELAYSSAKNIKYFHKRFLTGCFAFLILQDVNNIQYLALKRLENYESNHGVLHFFAKNGRFTDKLKNSQVLCGGEMVFKNGSIECWNLKSGGYSVGNTFDENLNPQIKKNIANLWLPAENKFKSIKENPLSKTNFTPRGSLRKPNEIYSESSDKTFHEQFNDVEILNMQSSTTLKL